MDIGETMLKNGAEVHRVEDTIARLCRAYGAVHTEIFAISTMIIAAVRMENGEYSSQMRRVGSSENNMHKVELFNEISRKACKEKPELSVLDDMIKKAKQKKTYPYWVVCCGAALATGILAVFFGGSWRDAIVAAVIGAIIALGEKIPAKNVNDFAKITLQSFVAGSLACIAVWAGIGQNPDKIMMGTIMYSIPGLTMGIAMRDLFYSDFIAGSLKIIQACLTSLMIALGYFLAMIVFKGVL
jgi:uncharacterized membrane protein YjjP (DUF1212 family)